MAQSSLKAAQFLAFTLKILISQQVIEPTCIQCSTASPNPAPPSPDYLWYLATAWTSPDHTIHHLATCDTWLQPYLFRSSPALCSKPSCQHTTQQVSDIMHQHTTVTSCTGTQHNRSVTSCIHTEQLVSDIMPWHTTVMSCINTQQVSDVMHQHTTGQWRHASTHNGSMTPCINM